MILPVGTAECEDMSLASLAGARTHRAGHLFAKTLDGARCDAQLPCRGEDFVVLRLSTTAYVPKDELGKRVAAGRVRTL